MDIAVAKRYRNLADYFKRSGETQAELADRVGVSQPQISLVLNGISCSFRLAKRIHAATGVPLETIGPEA